jgi:hypothetical protein
MSSFREATGTPLSMRIFEKYDRDNSGYISTSEFQHMIEDHGLQLNAKEMEIAMLTLDYDGNGRISYDEVTCSISLSLYIKSYSAYFLSCKTVSVLEEEIFISRLEAR